MEVYLLECSPEEGCIKGLIIDYGMLWFVVGEGMKFDKMKENIRFSHCPGCGKEITE